MAQDSYTYEVAFSFLAQDEALATQINDLLQDRLSTFLYSKRQEQLAGTDGEQSFNAVFSEQARTVVVLYREGWGKSSWTRIEETAIRNRAYEKGYDFVTFIPLNEPPSVPAWLPKTRLWIGLKRWGLAGVASAIEARVQEMGGMFHEESVEDRAKRLERTEQFRKRREGFRYSTDAVDAANKEFETLAENLQEFLVSIKQAANSISYAFKKVGRQIVIVGAPKGLSVDWICPYANTLADASLEVGIWNGHPLFPGVWHVAGQPRQLKKLLFEFDLLKSGVPGWVSKDRGNREFTTKALAEFVLKFYMDNAEGS